MSQRFLASIGASMTVVLGMLLAQAPTIAQQTKPAAAKAPAKKFTLSRTAWGDPDLQGVYTFATETPFQRPAALGTKDSYTEEEQKQLEAQLKDKQEENIETNEHFSYNALWFNSDQGRPTGRTSLLVDPENGRMPPMTPAGGEAARGVAGESSGKPHWKGSAYQYLGGPSRLYAVPRSSDAADHSRVQPWC